MTTELLPAGHAWILISLCFFLQTLDRVRLVVMQPLQPQLTVLDSLKQARSHHRSHPSYINATAILHKSQNPALFSLPYHLESPLSKPCYSLSPRTHDVKHGCGEWLRGGRQRQAGAAAGEREARRADASAARRADADRGAVLPLQPGPEHRRDRADRVLLQGLLRRQGGRRGGGAPGRAGAGAGPLPPARRPAGHQPGDEADGGADRRRRPVRGGRRRLRPRRRRRPHQARPRRARPARLLRPRRQEHPRDAAHDRAGDALQVRRLRAGPGHEPLHVRRHRRHGVRELVGRDSARRRGADRAAVPGPRCPQGARPAGDLLPPSRVRRDPRRLGHGGALRRPRAPLPLLLLRPGPPRARARPGACRRRARPVHNLRGALRPGLARAHRRAGAGPRPAHEAAVRRRRAPSLLAAAAEGVLRERHRADQRVGHRRRAAVLAAVPRGGAGAGGRAHGHRRVHALRGGLLRGDARAAVAGVHAAHHHVVAPRLPRRRLRLGRARHVGTRHTAGEGGHPFPRARQGEEEHQRAPRPAGHRHGRVPRAHGRDMIHR